MGSQRELVTKLLAEISGGHEVAAAHLGMSVGQFRDRLYMNKARFFDLDEVLKLQELSGTTMVADYFAESANSIIVPKPDVDMGNYDLFELTLAIGKARGEYEAYLLKAMADGVIDDFEEAYLDKLCDAILRCRMAAHTGTKATHKKATKGN